MKFGTLISGIVARFSKDGSGEIDRPSFEPSAPSAPSKPFHIYNTIPGETVTATFVKRTTHGPKAELVSVDVPSPSRVTPHCPYAGTCGGCKWQHVDYDAQFKAKVEMFERVRSEHGQAQGPAPTMIKAMEKFYYRNRMDFVFGRDGQLGLKTPDRWWETLDLETCFLLSPESVEIVNKVRVWAKSTGLPFWNAKTHEGFFRYLVIREGKRTGERMVMLVTGSLPRVILSVSEGSTVISQKLPSVLRVAQNDTTDVKEKISELSSLLGSLATSIVWGINSSITDLSIAEEIIPLKGNPWIHEEINNVRYKITPNAFFQTNTVMAEQLQNVVRDFCGDLSGKTLLDLFCGSGFFSLMLAKRPLLSKEGLGVDAVGAQRIVGIELSAEAIACAKENATANNIQAEYFSSKTEDFAWKTYQPDVVILDPPRAGLHPKVIETILEAKPSRIVYVSCNYHKFFEEMKALGEIYVIKKSALLDLFPHTPHVEAVFQLELK